MRKVCLCSSVLGQSPGCIRGSSGTRRGADLVSQPSSIDRTRPEGNMVSSDPSHAENPQSEDASLVVQSPN